MWARVIEITIGAWMAMSPFIFRHPVEKTDLWINDFACAALIILFASLSWVPKLRYAHLLSAVLGCWMMGYGWWMSEHPALGGYQNNICVGLCLAMFAIIPNRASYLPKAWREFTPEGAG